MAPVTATPATPCIARPDIYDALLDAEPETSTYQRAHKAAVTLCASCPAIVCADRVSTNSAPRRVATFDDTEWIAGPVLANPSPAYGISRYSVATRAACTTYGTGVVPAQDRPAEWARMAAELAAAGRSLGAIAEALCVSEATVTLLLSQPGHRSAA